MWEVQWEELEVIFRRLELISGIKIIIKLFCAGVIGTGGPGLVGGTGPLGVNANGVLGNGPNVLGLGAGGSMGGVSGNFWSQINSKKYFG